MLGLLRQPRWLILATVVGLITLLFANLGLWQLRRLDERRFNNAIQSERRAADPVSLPGTVDLDQATADAGEAYDGRPLTVSGTFDASEEVLLRSRTLDGEAGYHVITPLVLEDADAAVLVNRGWIPLSLGELPLTGRAASPPGLVEITGYAQASAVQPRFGPTDGPGDLDVFARADIDRIATQVPYVLYPVVLVSQVPSDLPIPVTPEPLDDGPHLLYAIQWFAFAVISVAGFLALLRSNAKKVAAPRRGSGGRHEQPTTLPVT